MEHQIVAFEREGGNQELGAGSVTPSASFLITVLERGIDGVHKLVRLQASLSPGRVKIRSWMFADNLSLGATLVHPMFHACGPTTTYRTADWVRRVRTPLI